MRPDSRFVDMSPPFWANVRTIGQEVGYTVRGGNAVRVPSMDEVRAAYERIGMSTSHLLPRGDLTRLGRSLQEYLAYRAETLNNHVEPRLMDARRASEVFRELRAKMRPKCPLPMNKQKGRKKTRAYLTGIVNMLVEANCDGLPVDYDPRQLTTVTSDGAPLRTLSRRLDGGFPSAVNPVAVWEIKEYYHTTTFGSRVADGVYETLLDGMELQELARAHGIKVEHVMMIDAHFTWWQCGKSYLCRVFDMLHMGYVDEVLFGYEVVESLPQIVRRWVSAEKARCRRSSP